MDKSFQLAVEEVALALTVIGKPELGRDLMVAQIGALSAEQAQARLMAAGHSLMSKDWMAIDQDGTVCLADSLARVAKVLAGADFSLVFSLNCPPASLTLTYHFSDGAIFEHTTEAGVVHRITEFSDPEGVLLGGLAFFGLQNGATVDSTESHLPAGIFDEVSHEQDTIAVVDRLTGGGVSPEIAEALAADLAANVIRGSALRVEYDAMGNPFSERGVLLLLGPASTWLARLESDGEGQRVAVRRGDPAAFRSEIAKLL